jgi:putative acetyltransferase
MLARKHEPRAAAEPNVVHRRQRMRIRAETETDRAAIHAVNRAAFGTSVEADLVDVLRSKAGRFVSLVAEADDAVVGHVLFSRAWLSGRDDLSIMGLGPMAVLPDYQRKGIGSSLVLAGLERCKLLGCQAVVVLGHAEYYPRFGFVPAARHAIRSEYDVPDDVFMVTELEAGVLRHASGVVRYDEAFGAA